MKTSEQQANEIFTSHYMVLFDSDTDKGEEILVSLLAIKMSIVTCNYLIEATSKKKYWEDVKKHLQEM